MSGYQFERFVLSYSNSDSLEIAAYRSAESYYNLSPRYSLDQEDTYKGLEKLQEFINAYPNSEYRDAANLKVMELSEKLQKKDIEIAKQYLKIGETLGTFKNAIEAFDNFILDHPGSKYRPDAYYGKFEAAYRLAINSFPSLVADRLQTSLKYYNDFNNLYEAISIISKRATQINTDIKKELIEKLDEFATYNDSLEEIFENKEQIEVSKFYEKLPKPHAIAIQEWLDDKIYYRNTQDEEIDS